MPLWVKLAAAVWIAVWFPAYVVVYGWANFLHWSDLSVALTAIGLWTSSRLLLSSQAVSSLLGDFIWSLDVFWRMAFGHHLIGGTEYLWDHHYPLWVRLLSFYHVLLPTVLCWSMIRLRYDRRGLALQAGIGAAALVAARRWGEKDNINFAFRDPIFHRVWGPAPLHLLAVYAGTFVVYLVTHWALVKAFPAARTAGA